jgi:hypothetical protein
MMIKKSLGILTGAFHFPDPGKRWHKLLAIVNPKIFARSNTLVVIFMSALIFPYGAIPVQKAGILI